MAFYLDVKSLQFVELDFLCSFLSILSFNQKKTVKRKTQAPKRKEDVPVRCPIEITEEQAEHLWQNEISIMLSACIQGRDGRIPVDTIVPFDLNSDLPDEEQMLVVVHSLICNAPVNLSTIIALILVMMLKPMQWW